MSDDMDGDIPQLLQQWGLPQYIHTFEVNHIKMSTLSMLDSSLAKELIPPIGDRAKFLRNLDNWNKLTNPEECPVIPSTSSSPAPVFVDMLNPKHRQIQSVSEFLIPLNNNNTSTQLNDSDVIILATTREDEVATTSEDQVATTSEDHVATTSEDQDMTICNEDVCSPLKKLLLESNEGRGLLNLYSEQGKLSNNGRRKVCNIIIKDLMESDPNKRIDSSILLTKAQEISEVFKKENISTYFIPYINDTKLKIKRCAKGKLYDCLQNRRRKLREAKVIKKKNCSNIDNNSNEPLEISEHNFLYLKYSKKSLTPKFHYLTHYPKMLIKFGPLVNIWSMRYEAKHRISKLYANVTNNRINICKSLAIKHQLQLNNKFISNTFMKQSFDCGRKKTVSDLRITENIVCQLKLELTSLYKCNWVQVNGIKYTANMTLTLDFYEDKLLPKFGLIENIVIADDYIAIFECSLFDTLCFNEHLFCFDVELLSDRNTYFFSIGNIASYVPNNLTLSVDGKHYYVTPRSSI